MRPNRTEKYKYEIYVQPRLQQLLFSLLVAFLLFLLPATVVVSQIAAGGSERPAYWLPSVVRKHGAADVLGKLAQRRRTPACRYALAAVCWTTAVACAAAATTAGFDTAAAARNIRCVNGSERGGPFRGQVQPGLWCRGHELPGRRANRTCRCGAIGPHPAVHAPSTAATATTRVTIANAAAAAAAATGAIATAAVVIAAAASV